MGRPGRHLGVLLCASLRLSRRWALAALGAVAFAVSLQPTPLQERLPTEPTRVRPLTAVDLLVAPECSGSGEALAADSTAVRFDSRVASHVHLHVLEGSPTDPTGSASLSVGL